MNLAAPRVDIGLHTNNLDAMLAFWQGEVGAEFKEALPIRPGMTQYRHDVNGSVLKINHHSASLPTTPPAGYRELLIARNGLTAVKQLKDPDENLVSLVPSMDNMSQIGVRLYVRDCDVHRRFYSGVLGLRESSPGSFHAGDSALFFTKSADAVTDASFEGKGWRYITFQVFKVDEEHAGILALGGREALAPVTLGKTARISMIRDPDGNWIEISQRASIVGPLS